MYVWLDALNNYVTGVRVSRREAPRWNYWPADVHFVGKDIIRFHAVYWPAFLMAAGLPVPKRITSNGWWVMDGEKMSKSLGNVVEPRKLAETFGLDQIRYFLLREKPFGADGSHEPRGHHQPHQRRSGERSRQPGAAHVVAGGAQLRRRVAGARRR